MTKHKEIVLSLSALAILGVFITVFLWLGGREARGGTMAQSVSKCATSDFPASTSTNGSMIYLTPTSGTTTVVSSCAISTVDSFSFNGVAVGSSSAPTGSNPPVAYWTYEYSDDSVTWISDTQPNATKFTATSTEIAFSTASTTRWIDIRQSGGNMEATSTWRDKVTDPVSKFVRVRMWVSDGNMAFWGYIHRREQN